MRRIVVTRPGGLDRLAVQEAPSRPLQAGEVRIETKAIGINFADVAVRLGIYDAVKDYPACPGFEVAGTVSETAPDVTSPSPGDRVFAAVRFEAYADEVVAHESLTWSIPGRLDFEEAAALPVNVATAWHALFGLAHARPGERVLVHSAAGGVGLAACQLGERAGLDVVGVVGRRRKVEAAQEHGARVVVDGESGDIWPRVEQEGPFDVILDANGQSTLKRGWKNLAPMGRLVVYGFATMLQRGRDRLNWPLLALRFLRTPRFSPFDMVMENKSIHGFNLVHLFHSDTLKEELGRAIEECAADETYRIPQITRFSFEEAAKAHAALASGETVGKLVLTV